MRVATIRAVALLGLLVSQVSCQSSAPGETTDAVAGREQSQRQGMVVVHHRKTDTVLINPGAGWQWLAHRPPAGEMEKMPLVGTVYYRATWTEFEPERGQY